MSRLSLSDGRELGFQTLGDPADPPLFFFHGTPGSRLTLAEEDGVVESLGAFLILPDRPGYGISSPKPGRSLLDWADDVEALADHFAIARFAVAGESGGGPHAFASAYRLPERVTKVLTFGSPAPANFKGATRGMALGNRLAMVLGRVAPWLVRRLIRGFATSFKRDPERFMDAIAAQMATPDQTLMQIPAVRQAMLRDCTEAYRQGSEGHVTDSGLAMNPDWGFSLREISVPAFIWHGERDTLVSAPMMERLAEELPRCEVHVVKDAGHLLLENPAVLAQVKAILREEGSAPA
ncbi:MAG: alpha/beta hydrolase [Planctomycetota bacterium]